MTMTAPIRTIQITLPEQIATEIDRLIKAGWFDAESDVIRVPLLAYLRRHRFESHERFQLEDIAWALEQKKQAESDRRSL